MAQRSARSTKSCSQHTTQQRVAINQTEFVTTRGPLPEFRYLWARDEAQRLHRENPEWLSQETITLRFREVLIAASWDSVFERILREGQLHRETHNRLAQTASAELVTVRIDPESLATTTDQQAYEWVTEAGFALVAAGQGAFVINLVRMLPTDRANEPRVRLVAGYAAHSLGEYFTARTDLGRAAMHRMSFTPIDRYMLDALLLDSDYFVGRIDLKEMQERQFKLETEAPQSIACQLRLDRLRRKHISERDPVNRAAAADEIRQVVQSILSDSEAIQSVKLRARLTRLYAEVSDQDLENVQALAIIRARADMGMHKTTPDVLALLERTFAANNHLDQESNACVREAVAMNHPLLIAEAILTRIVILICRVMNTRVMLSKPGQPLDPPSGNDVETGLNQLQLAENYFRAARSDEGVVRVVLAQADWLVTFGRLGEAVERARSVEGLAYGIGSDRYQRRVAEHLSGATEHHVLLDTVSNPPDEVKSLATSTDAELKRCAVHALTVLGLPHERLPVIERECFSWRAISREELSWCRHIELQQDVRHERSPETHFRTDPERVCYCTKHHYKSVIPMPDWEVLLASFKGSRCAGCHDRSPKEDPK